MDPNARPSGAKSQPAQTVARLKLLVGTADPTTGILCKKKPMSANQAAFPTVLYLDVRAADLVGRPSDDDLVAIGADLRARLGRSIATLKCSCE
jgi:hypothetical protein